VTFTYRQLGTEELTDPCIQQSKPQSSTATLPAQGVPKQAYTYI